MAVNSSWYRGGTCTTTAGSTDVVGTDTEWSLIVKSGDIFTIDGSVVYEVASVISATRLRLKTPFPQTLTNTPYAIIQNFTGTLPAQLASDLSKMQRAWYNSLRDYVDVLTTDSMTSTITKIDESKITVPSWKAITSPTAEQVSEATAAKNQAVAAKDEAIAAVASIGSSVSDAQASQVAAEAASANALVSSQTASTKATEASSSAIQATESATAANNYAQSALNSESTYGTSSDSKTISTGVVSLSIQTNKMFISGHSVIISKDNDHWMWGNVVSYNKTSGGLSVDVLKTKGEGTFSSWVVALSPDPSTGQATSLVDNLESTSTTSALTANQGRVLNTTKANLDSPTFTGTPKAPTPNQGDNSDALATTKYVDSKVIPVASSTQDGLMSSADKTKLDGLSSTGLSIPYYFFGFK